MQGKRSLTSVLAILLAGSAAQADLLSADISIGGGSLASADIGVGGRSVGATATVGGGSVADASVSIGHGVGASVGIGGGSGGHSGGGGNEPSNTSGGSSIGGSAGGSAVTYASGRGGSGSRMGSMAAIRNLSLYSQDGVRLGTILSMEDAGSLTRVTIKLDPALGHGTSRMTFRTAVRKHGDTAFRIGQSVRAFVSLL